MSFINWGSESPEQLTIRKRFEEEYAIYEQMTYSAAVSAAAGSSTVLNKYIVIINTSWIYPIADVESVIAQTSNIHSINGSDLIFSNIEDLVNFYDEVYTETAASQPSGNPGYSIGVGTILQEKRKSITLKLVTGETIVRWKLMEQLTNQSDLPQGGSSPNGTIGYGSIYNDYDIDGVQDPTDASPPSEYSDPLRIIKYIS